MKLEKLREKTNEELKDRLTNKQEALDTSLYDKARGQVKDTSEIKIIKKDIARIKTILKEKSNSNKDIN